MTQHSRAAKIAAIHALAQMYADHPDLPMPEAISLHTSIARDAGTEAHRVAEVVFAGELECAGLSLATYGETHSRVTAMRMLPGMWDHGISVALYVAAELDARPDAARYIGPDGQPISRADRGEVLTADGKQPVPEHVQGVSFGEGPARETGAAR
jgi:hypothetical protein